MSNNISSRNESHVYLKVDDTFAFAHSILLLVKLCCHKNDQDRAHRWLNYPISRMLCLLENTVCDIRRLPKHHTAHGWVHRQQHNSEGGNGNDCALRLLVRDHARYGSTQPRGIVPESAAVLSMSRPCTEPMVRTPDLGMMLCHQITVVVLGRRQHKQTAFLLCSSFACVP